MLSYVAHLKNKYPGGIVFHNETSIDAYDNRGRHRVALRKNGAGQWACESKKLGAKDEFCLAPIPKNVRVHKLYAAGHLAPSEEAPDRLENAKALATDGRVPSSAELLKLGASFDDAGNLLGVMKKVEPRPIGEILGDIQKAVVPDVIDVDSSVIKGDF